MYCIVVSMLLFCFFNRVKNSVESSHRECVGMQYISCGTVVYSRLIFVDDVETPCYTVVLFLKVETLNCCCSTVINEATCIYIFI